MEKETTNTLKRLVEIGEIDFSFAKKLNQQAQERNQLLHSESLRALENIRFNQPLFSKCETEMLKTELLSELERICKKKKIRSEQFYEIVNVIYTKQPNEWNSILNSK